MGGIISKKRRISSEIKRNNSVVRGSDKITKSMSQAIKEGDLKKVKELIEGGVNVDSMLNYYNTPLILSSQYIHQDICLYLISKGANINCINERNATSLLYSCLENLDQLFDELISRDVQVNQQSALVYSKIIDKTIPVTPLSACIVAENYDHFNILIHKGATYNEEIAINCLELSIQYKNIPAIEFLMTLPKIYPTSTYYQSPPLILCIIYKKFEIFTNLLSHGFSHKVKSNNQENLLFLSIKHNSLEIFEYLLMKYKWDLNMKDINGKTLLHLAVLIGNIKIVNILLQQNINIDICDNNSIYPIDLTNDQEIIDLLLSESKIQHKRKYVKNPDYINFVFYEMKKDVLTRKVSIMDESNMPSGILKRPSINIVSLDSYKKLVGLDNNSEGSQSPKTQQNPHQPILASHLSKNNNKS